MQISNEQVIQLAEAAGWIYDELEQFSEERPGEIALWQDFDGDGDPEILHIQVPATLQQVIEILTEEARIRGFSVGYDKGRFDERQSIKRHLSSYYDLIETKQQ